MLNIIKHEGTTGVTGPKGETGLTGPIGPTGLQGEIGPTGAKGEKGDKGPKNTQGKTGATGNVGPKGEIGEIGPVGPKGKTGATGLKGNKGAVGETGTQKGPTGDTGLTGVRGEIGDCGPVGAEGLVGAKGEIGDLGKTGSLNFSENDYCVLTYSKALSVEPSTTKTIELSVASGKAMTMTGEKINIINPGTYYVNYAVYPAEVNANALSGFVNSEGIAFDWSNVQILIGEHCATVNHSMRTSLTNPMKFFIKSGNGTVIFKEKTVNTPNISIVFIKIK